MPVIVKKGLNGNCDERLEVRDCEAEVFGTLLDTEKRANAEYLIALKSGSDKTLRAARRKRTAACAAIEAEYKRLKRKYGR